MEKAVIIIPMTKQEARECVDQIKNKLTNIRALVLKLYEGKGWDILGYSNWRECVTVEFGENERYLYKQLEAAQVEKNICPMGQKEIPERQLRPLVQFKDDPATQREVWEKAKETAPDGKVTAAHVEKVVKEFTTERKEVTSAAASHYGKWTPFIHTTVGILGLALAKVSSIPLLLSYT